MTAILTSKRTEKDDTVLSLTNVNPKKRSATDKYWIVLFIIAIVILINVGPRVVIRHGYYEPIDESNPNDTFVQTFFYNTNPRLEFINGTFENCKIIDYASSVWGQNWIFDAITCNVSFLNENYERSGIIVIVAYVLFSVSLIIYSFHYIDSDKMLLDQLGLCSLCLACFSAMSGIIFELIAESDLTSFTRRFTLYSLMIIPVVIICLIVITRIPAGYRMKGKKNNPLVISREMASLLYPPIQLFMCFFTFLFYCFVTYKAYGLKKGDRIIWEWGNNWSHAVSLLSIIYICLTLYYSYLMTISCNASLSIEKPSRYYKNILSAFFTTARYHFGTACYHATLILPRIHATFLAINDTAVIDKKSKLSAIKRIYMTHWKLYNTLTMMTGVKGYDYSKSVKELLRLVAHNSPNSKYFQSCHRILNISWTLTLGIFSLVLMSLWAHGIIIASSFTIRIWIMYFIGRFTASVIIRFFDATYDTVWYLYD